MAERLKWVKSVLDCFEVQKIRWLIDLEIKAALNK